MSTNKKNDYSVNHAFTVEGQAFHLKVPVVSICCITYNHENFIRDAIEGFLLQKTEFPIEILIHDDASTDNTAAIVREYEEKHPDLIRAIYQTENRFSKGLKNFPLLYNMARGKYIALCEGDDYWTDPLKLQKQFDFMESHSACSICCHKLVEKDENGVRQDRIFPVIQGDQILDKSYLYRNFFIRTCTVMFRNNEIEELIYFLEDFKVGDAPLFYYYARRGKIGYIDDTMAVYRMHNGGVWSSKPVTDILLSSLSTRLLLQKKQRIYFSTSFYKGSLELLLRIANQYKRDGNFFLFKKYAFKSIPYLLFADDEQRRTIFKYIRRIIAADLLLES